MVLELYMTPLSPPSRAVLLTIKSLNLDVDIKHVDLSKGEHRKKEYIKINPQHAVPALVDNEVVICDSHAINAYLVRKYGKDDDPLYPKDCAKRALVDVRLHFDSGSLFKFIREIAGPIFYGKTKVVPEEKARQVLDAYSILEVFLQQSKWTAGDAVTIADFSLATTVTSLDVLVPLNKKSFPKIGEWLTNFEKLPVATVNKPGLEDFKNTIEMCMKQK